MEFTRLTAAVASELDRRLQTPLPAGLYLVATPIGNLADVTLRALAVLQGADIVCCEDTRHSAKLFAHFGLAATKLRPFHEHNEEAQRPRILEELRRGRSVAVISDAGTPLISDPGYKLVRQAAEEGINVVAVPGPSAVLAALSGSGLPPDAFFFAGFLPTKRSSRKARIEELAHVPGTLVFFESPQRLAECMEDLAAGLGDRPAVVARELTKMHEIHLRGSLNALAAAPQHLNVKGEIVIVVAPPGARDISDGEIVALLSNARRSMTLRDAAKHVAEALGVPKSRVYALGLEASGER